MKKILILTWSYWSWHNAAAENLKKYYEEKWYLTKKIDIVNFLNNIFCNKTKKIYEKYPKTWKLFFKITDWIYLIKFLYFINIWIKQEKFDSIIKEYKPDKIISVFPFWNLWLKKYIDKYKKDFNRSILITDSINIQSFWYINEKYIDKYFVIDSFSKKIIEKKFKIKKDKIITSGFPIINQNITQKEIIDNKKILILLTWLDYKNIKAILENLPWYEINIIEWRNKDLYEKLKKEYKNNFNFYEYINIIEKLNKVWIFIWKPGWAITSECIYTKTPIIMPTFFPGQEEWNKILVEKLWIWFFEKDSKKTVDLIKNYNWNNIIQNFEKIKKKNNIDIIYNNL